MAVPYALMFLRPLTLLSLFAVALGSAAQITVNELMASNDGAVSDPTGAAPDWIELYNAGDTPYSLVGHWISDDPLEPLKHQLTGSAEELTVPPGGFLVLWATGDASVGPRYLDFSLSAGGEQVLLLAPDGTTLIDHITFAAQLADVSYGRLNDGEAAWRFFDVPTPGASNNSSTGYLGFLDAPTFAVAPGFHSAAPITAINSTDADVQIWYSLDGSEPTPDDQDGTVYHYKYQFSAFTGQATGPLLNDTMRSFPYSGPVQLPDLSNAPNNLSVRNTTIEPPYHQPTTLVRKGCVLRARAFKEGYLPSRVTSGTYIVTPGGINPYTLPVMPVVTDPENLFGYETGLITAGIDYDNWRALNPNADVNYTCPANWQRDTELPMHIELIPETGTTPDFAVNTGFRIHGQSSTSMARKSMRVYFRSRYGQDALAYPMFNGQNYSDHRTWIIRQSGADQRYTNMRDWTVQDMCAPLEFDTQAGRAVVLFINGEFWGVHQLIERIDDDFLYNHYGLEKEDIDLLDRNSEVVEGNAAHYAALMSYVANNPMTSAADYDHVNTQMDIANYGDFFSAEIFVGHLDWPRNNTKYFRKRVPFDPSAPPGQDGRWRWIMFDTDHTFAFSTSNTADRNYLARVLDGTVDEWATRLFRRLMLNERFRREWINRHADLLNTAFLTSVTSQVIQDHRDLIAHDMTEHFPRWVGQPGSLGGWNLQLGKVTAFNTARRAYAIQEVITSLNVPAAHELTIDVSHEDHGFVHINTIDLLPSTYGVAEAPYPWTGTYYESIPVTLTAQAFPGFTFSHWEGASSSTDPTIQLDLITADTVIAVFVPGVLCEHVALHQWNFNAMSGEAVTEVLPDASMMTGASITYPGTGAGYMDATDDSEGTTLNASEGMAAGRALRVRNPSDTRQLIIAAPSNGHRDVRLSYATSRTSAGATEQQLEWTVDPDRLNWHDLPPTITVGTDFAVVTAELDGITEAYDNAHLAFRITFLGDAASGATGNDRFDNVLVQGAPIAVTDTVMCQGEAVLFNGITYSEPGDVLVDIPGVLDCGHQVLLRLREVLIDTTVTTSSASLFAQTQVGEIQWLDCEDMAPIPGANSAMFQPEANGNYAVSITDDGCTARSGCHTINSVGLNELASGGISLLPVPAYDELTLIVPATLNKGSYTIRSLTGNIIASGSITSTHTGIDLRNIASGSYSFSIHDDRPVLLRFIKL